MNQGGSSLVTSGSACALRINKRHARIMISNALSNTHQIPNIQLVTRAKHLVL
jgi:hypothetical protein